MAASHTDDSFSTGVEFTVDDFDTVMKSLEPPSKRPALSQTEKRTKEPTKLSKHEVLSCSWRTDVPAFHMDWFLEVLRAGAKKDSSSHVIVKNPHPLGMPSMVSVSPLDVKAWVLWSKDFGPFLEATKPGTEGANLAAMYPAWVFHFTINGEAHSELEPGVRTSLSERAEQAKELTKRFGVDSLILRFDPITHYRRVSDPPGMIRDNTFSSDSSGTCWFAKVCEIAVYAGVTDVTIGFAKSYVNAARCMLKEGLEFVNLSAAQKIEIVGNMQKIATEHGIKIRGCADPIVNEIPDIAKAGCVDSGRIDRLLLWKGKPPLKSHKKNSWAREGCRCISSTDIGSYEAPLLCGHKCIYCYARHGGTHKSDPTPSSKSQDIEDIGTVSVPHPKAVSCTSRFFQQKTPD